jgi:hypothetical protein
MSTRTNSSPFRVGDRISERAARRALAHFRATAVKGALTAAPDLAKATGNDHSVTGGSASDHLVLRRWSVAELIAGATWRRAVV